MTGCVLALVAVAVLSSSSNGAGIPAETGAAARALTGRSEAQLEALPALRNDKSGVLRFRDRAHGEKFWVDRDNRAIRFQQDAGYSYPRGSKLIGASAARAAADAFVNRMHRGLMGSADTSVTVRLTYESPDRDGGGTMPEYEVLYSEVKGGIRTLNTARVLVNGETGLVKTAYVDFQVTDLPAGPSIARERAIALAGEALGLPNFPAAKCELGMWRARALDIPETLTWTVEIETGNEEVGGLAIAWVNAVTGEVMNTAYAGN